MKELLKGNIAIAQAAIDAGCEGYFAYPITPQSAIGEYMSKKMPKLGRAFVCAESEIAAINMVIGAASTGAKAMTSSSSCAVALMQEALTYAAGDDMPLVLVSVMRAGPGLGNIFPSQADYEQATVGGGNGDYKIITLAPSNIQECIDFTHKAFYLSQKYRTPVILLADGLLGQMMEPAEFKAYDYPEIDNSDWALTGAKNRAGRAIYSFTHTEKMNIDNLERRYKKYKDIEENEVMYEEHNVEDADIIIVAFGSLNRNINSAMKEARKKGLKVGTFRPITLYPFPEKRLNELAQNTKKFLVVEMNMGQMIKDVKLAVNEHKAKAEHLGRPTGKWISTEEIVKYLEKMD